MKSIKDDVITISINSNDKQAFKNYCDDLGKLENGLKATPSRIIREQFILPILQGAKND